MINIFSQRTGMTLFFLFVLVILNMGPSQSLAQSSIQASQSFSQSGSSDSTLTVDTTTVLSTQSNPTIKSNWYETPQVQAAIIAAIITFVGILIQLRISEKTSVEKFKLAAIDKRLEVHQEAYSLCRQMIRKLHKEDELAKLVDTCDRWWDENCLYLGKKSREAFFKAYNNGATSFHTYSYQDEDGKKEKKKIRDYILQTLELIEKETGLPPIADAKQYTEKFSH